MPASPYKILFVDDEENNLIAFKNAFFRTYTIFTASSASQGLDVLEKYSIHLVITDQRMPQVSGLEFLTIVKEKYPLAIRMVITGYSDVEVIMRAFNELDIFHYALKPWNNQELKIIIDNALTKYQLTSDNICLIKQLQQANESLEEKVKLRTQELEQKNEEYAQLNALKDKLFSIISHDIRSPLASLSALVNMFLNYKDIFSEEEVHEAMSDMKHSLVDITEMLNNLLSWAQAQIQNTEPLLEAHSIGSTLQKNIRAYQAMAAHKNIAILTELPAGDFQVQIDENITSLILRNLISNAIKFTPEHGQIILSSVAEKEYATISVTDTGVGISEETLTKLFSNEHLITSLGTAQEKGTGLGLKLCKEYVEKQGGVISVQSRLQKGTVFSFTVPVSK
ncbi:hybrid sensor histidine kinase/response regulator [Rhodocytophaga rosea]|uniref:histidine kinase n=1 Tax=Rhodocytophaga rosea TaxID=2704465 RepID=A0A6C0GL77_9BACT|nr:hybrid sensor histidine kinase/response regulator [Rhodocytophaga rosea]QHT68739.1 hybrid sensor histidine kinase/response regulator [Rhodocytophaga rosea]